jgi:sigma-B regulation protein RsbU (phosphoserine phosphatase)
MHELDNNAALKNLSAIVDFSSLINSNLDLNFTLNNLVLTCFGKFHTSKGFVALTDKEENLTISFVKGTKSGVEEKFPNIKVNELDESKELKLFKEEYSFPVHVKIESTNKIVGVLFLGSRLSGENYESSDYNLLNTLCNIAASAIANSQSVDELISVNRSLDAKVNQLSSLFDLSREFSSILETDRVGKLLVFSIIGQLMVTRFAVVTLHDNDVQILESKYNADSLLTALQNCDLRNISVQLTREKMTEAHKELADLDIELIIPMQIKSQTKGLILLGKRSSQMSFSQSDIDYISSIGSLAIISIENSRLFKEALEKQRYEKDLEIAQNIQRNLLPGKLPDFANFEIEAINNSARQVGGDYYDVIKLDEERTLFAIADVSGKGVQAALLMANLQAFLMSISKQNIELNEASNLINDLVSENTTDGSFITFFWGIINDTTKMLTYVNMGHNPPLLVRNKEIRKLKVGGMILGVMPTVIPYKSESVQLENGDLLVLFTDGITEAMNKEGEEYSDEKLEELVLGMGHCSSKETLNNILDDVANFIQGAQQSDDITALILKVK